MISMCVIVHLSINACPVEWRLPWLRSLVVSGPWRLPLRLISPTLMTLLFTSGGDVATPSELSSSDWPDWYSFSRIWGKEQKPDWGFLFFFLFSWFRSEHWQWSTFSSGRMSVLFSPVLTSSGGEVRPGGGEGWSLTPVSISIRGGAESDQEEEILHISRFVIAKNVFVVLKSPFPTLYKICCLKLK